ncbi:MAG: sugar phosphate isomerase/epimerase [Ferruginibacter sp.]
MTTRRSFIKTSSLLSAGLLLAPHDLSAKSSLIGVQLYTVRDAMQKDPAEAIAQIAKIGFTSVEGATYTGTQKFYGMTPAEFAALLKSNGLIMPSAHYRLGEEMDKGAIVKGTILHEWDKAVDDAAAVGLKYMVCAYLSDVERGNLDHYKKVADQLNVAGERCKKAGIQLCYHNHDFEFVKQDDVYPYDILLGTDADLVKMEADLYWVSKAGQNPVELFKKHPGRFPLWHLKDMDDSANKAFTEVGNGVIDFKEIFKHKKEAGLKYSFVEQDKCPGSPFDSLTKSISYIKKTGLKS